MKSHQTRWLTACAVSYASLVLTHFKLLDGPRGALCDAASEHLPVAVADKVNDLAHCPYCVSFWIALVVHRGGAVRAAETAGLASLPTSAVLVATD